MWNGIFRRQLNQGSKNQGIFGQKIDDYLVRFEPMTSTVYVAIELYLAILMEFKSVHRMRYCIYDL